MRPASFRLLFMSNLLASASVFAEIERIPLQAPVAVGTRRLVQACPARVLASFLVHAAGRASANRQKSHHTQSDHRKSATAAALTHEATSSAREQFRQEFPAHKSECLRADVFVSSVLNRIAFIQSHVSFYKVPRCTLAGPQGHLQEMPQCRSRG